MLGIVIVLAAAGVHMGSMDRAPAVAMLEELPIGEAVRVEDVHGRVVSGTIADVPGKRRKRVTIAEKESAVVVQRHEVLVVKRQDSIVNGVLVGVAAGVNTVGGAMVDRPPYCARQRGMVKQGLSYQLRSMDYRPAWQSLDVAVNSNGPTAQGALGRHPAGVEPNPGGVGIQRLRTKALNARRLYARIRLGRPKPADGSVFRLVHRLLRGTVIGAGIVWRVADLIECHAVGHDGGGAGPLDAVTHAAGGSTWRHTRRCCHVAAGAGVSGSWLRGKRRHRRDDAGSERGDAEHRASWTRGNRTRRSYRRLAESIVDR